MQFTTALQITKPEKILDFKDQPKSQPEDTQGLLPSVEFSAVERRVDSDYRIGNA
jgi:hypothetical protein